MTSSSTRRFPGVGAPLLLLALVMLVMPRATHADTATAAGEVRPGTRIGDYVFGRPRLEIMARQARTTDAALHLQPDCTGDLRVNPKGLILLAPIDLPDGRAAPVAGRWEIRYDVVRCGDTKGYSIFFAARPDGDAVATAAFPGSSIASERLLRDAVVVASASAHMAQTPPDCKSAILADTRVDRPPQAGPDGRAASPWNEAWTFDVCGRSVEVPIAFVPTPADGGTDFHVDMKAVHVVPHR